MSLLNRTAQVLATGLPVAKVSGGEDQETRPAVSRASTFTVYRVPGSRLPTVSEVPAVSPSCSLTAPCCRYTSYFAIGAPPGAAGGQERVAVRSVTAPAVGRPGAPGRPSTVPAGRSTSVVSEYGGSVRVVALPERPVATPLAPLASVCTVGASAAGVKPA